LKITQAERLRHLPPYLFAEIDRKRAEVAARGVDIISLGIGDPDLPTFPHIVEALKKGADNPANHRYPDYEGTPAFRAAAAEWMRGRFGVSLNPGNEVVSLIGSKEGIAHIPLAFVDPGDVVLCTSPGYPVYRIGTLFAGGEPHPLPLTEENGFLPDLEGIPARVLKKAKLFFFNYPNNPTGAGCGPGFFEKVVEFAAKHGVIACHDSAYSEMFYDGKAPGSFLATPGAREVGVEFHSLSKTYNMTGWRVGFACGNADVISGLGKIKTNIDSGIFQAVQEAGIAALTGDQSPVAGMRRVYQERRDLAAARLRKMGFSFLLPPASFYMWVRVPQGHTSASFCARVLAETGVVLTPGNGFGDAGEGYFRIALTVGLPRLAEALDRLEKMAW
jgi:LL-diaminopimelate aminotransferase